MPESFTMVDEDEGWRNCLPGPSSSPMPGFRENIGEDRDRYGGIMHKISVEGLRILYCVPSVAFWFW